MRNKVRFPEKDFKKLLLLALKEDVGPGDVTSIATIDKSTRSTAVLLAKDSGIAAGLPAIPIIFNHIKSKASLRSMVKEGQEIKSGDLLYKMTAPTRDILIAERILLNFIQRLSGIATNAHRLQGLVKQTKTKILDTRKTLPGFRTLDKYAVKIGGASNHRMGLYDRILIKDNHIQACGSVLRAVEKARKKYGDKILIEAEVTSLKQLGTLFNSEVDWVMLDNMNRKQMKKAVSLIKEHSPRIKLEASGNMDEKKIRALSDLGLDYISAGSLTHSVKAMDISLKFV